MTVRPFGQWAEAARIMSQMQAKFRRATTVAMLQEANRIRGHIIKNLTSGGSYAGRPFAGLSSSTLVLRQFRGFGGTKPLIQTGALRASVAVVQMGPGAVFIGVKRTGKGGANVAAVHEFGAQYQRPMTDKQRRFLHMAFRRMGGAPSPGTGGGMLRVRIPARPFITPVMDRFAQPNDVRRRFWTSIARSMGGDFGTP